MNPINIFLVDDHAVVLDGLVAALSMFPAVKVVGTAMSGEVALQAIDSRRSEIDVVVTDYTMGGMDGVTLCQHLKGRDESPRVMLLTMHPGPEVAFRAVRNGIDRIVLKSTSIDKVVENIVAVMNQDAGAPFPNPADDPANSENPDLTKTEMLILQLITHDELTTKEIAEKLFRSVHTIDRHRKSLLLKLGVRNTAGLVNFAHRIKLYD